MSGLSGPFFAPGVDELVDREIGKSRELVADAAYVRVIGLLHDFERHPHGYDASRIRVNRALAERDVVQDTNAVYGPWLEGVGSRNRTSRFKGYHVFRIVASGMQQRAVDIAHVDAGRIARLLS